MADSREASRTFLPAVNGQIVLQQSCLSQETFSDSETPLKIPLRPKLLQKILFNENCFGTINFVKITKQSLYKSNSLACSLASRDKPVAAILQRKCFGGKIITKIIVSRDYFVIISARMVVFWRPQNYKFRTRMVWGPQKSWSRLKPYHQSTITAVKGLFRAYRHVFAPSAQPMSGRALLW